MRISNNNFSFIMPIIKLSNGKTIGLHIEENQNSNYKKGLSFKYFLKELIYQKDLNIFLSTKFINYELRQRLLDELKMIKKKPSLLFTFHPTDYAPYIWESIFIGPDNSPYKNGVFCLNFEFPENYPLFSPKFEFRTKIYNRNLFKGQEYSISKNKKLLNALNCDIWHTCIYIYKILDLLNSVLNDDLEIDYNKYMRVDKEKPNDIYKNNREIYEKKASLWTQKYASINLYYNYNVFG